jgi:uncharacterized delta-60 repeat protein
MNWWKKVRARRQPTPYASFKPLVEPLENRLVPAGGAIDPGFGHNGIVNLNPGHVAKAVVVQGDGKIVVLDQTQTGYDILRFNSDGSPDTTFGTNGEVAGTFGAGTMVVNLAVLPDGSIVVGGGHGSAGQTEEIDAFNGPGSGYTIVVGAGYFVDVARFHADGTVDSAFGTGGIADIAFGSDGNSSSDITAADMAVSSDGSIVLVGMSENQPVTGLSAPAMTVVDLHPDGSLNKTFGNNGIVTSTVATGADAVAIESDGKIVVAGHAKGELVLARYNTDGGLDTGFGNSGIASTPFAGATFSGAHLAIDPADNGLLVTDSSYTLPPVTYPYYHGVETIGWLSAAPFYTTQYSSSLLRFDGAGTLDTNFGTNGEVNLLSNEEVAPALALQADGKILVGGAGSPTSVTRYTASGSLDISWGNGGTATPGTAWDCNSPTALAIQGDGKVVVASDAIVARLLADSDRRPVKFGSENALREYLIDQAVQQYQWELGQVRQLYTSPWYVGPIMYDLVATRMLTGAALATGTLANTSFTNAAVAVDSNTVSTTNTQVQGVDEGDTVKTDGRYLYVLSGDNLVILNAWPAAQLSILSTTALDGSPLAEYLIGNRLTVISQTYAPVPLFGAISWPCNQGSQVEVTVYDVSVPATPSVVQETKYDGSYDTSRAIGGTIYLALNNFLSSLPPPQSTTQGNTIVYETETQYRTRLEALPLDQFLPHYTTYVNGRQDTELLSLPQDLYQAGVPGDTNLLSVVSLNVASGVGGPTQAVTFLTSYGDTLFAATDSFYLVSSRWSYVSDWTFIDKLSLEDGGIELTATGAVPGTVLNQFSMGENGAYFYIATTSGWGASSTNSVFVLTQNDHSLDLVGGLGNIAPGETITAIRFMGDRAFVSTFLYRDPLFVIDLSDPAAPSLAGALQFPGYTAYLQLLDDSHLLDVGWRAGHAGVQITLFDISDLSNPVMISRYDVSPGDSWTEAPWDYHSITWYPQYQTLTLPVATSSVVSGPNGSCTWVSQTDELVFHVDQSGLAFVGQVSDGAQISRGVFINDMLYTISDVSVEVHALDNLSQQVAQVMLPPPAYYTWWWRPVETPLPVTVELNTTDVAVKSTVTTTINIGGDEHGNGTGNIVPGTGPKTTTTGSPAAPTGSGGTASPRIVSRANTKHATAAPSFAPRGVGLTASPAAQRTLVATLPAVGMTASGEGAVSSGNQQIVVTAHTDTFAEPEAGASRKPKRGKFDSELPAGVLDDAFSQGSILDHATPALIRALRRV